MKYAFLKSYFSIAPIGGVQNQVLMWKEGLERLGHTVDLVDNWGSRRLGDYDVLLIFSYGEDVHRYWSELSLVNPNIVLAPILDPEGHAFLFKMFLKYWGNKKFFKLSNKFHNFWLARKIPKLWLVRSEEERHFVHYCFDVPQDKIVKVPLHFRVPSLGEIPQKENFCFHASRLTYWRKNVPRLVEAAKKYGFQLKLAGFLKGDSEREWLKQLIGDAQNIEYLGELSEEGLRDIYKRAKAVALPSLYEGVGMVALEGAAYGCEVVLTNVGAPKEYYNGMAILINPKSVDDIGRGIMKALSTGHGQPQLKSHVEQNYNRDTCCELLHEAIRKGLNL